MNWIEVIQLKSFTKSDQDEAVALFHELSSPVLEKGLNIIKLFGNLTLENELTILLDWYNDIPPNGKSRLGLQLAAALSKFGYIYHSAWQQSAKLISQQWRDTHEHQTTV